MSDLLSELLTLPLFPWVRLLRAMAKGSFTDAGWPALCCALEVAAITWLLPFLPLILAGAGALFLLWLCFRVLFAVRGVRPGSRGGGWSRRRLPDWHGVADWASRRQERRFHHPPTQRR